MSDYGWPTVRKFPRTLSDAFPGERANSVEHHRRVPLVDGFGGIIITIIASAVCGVLLAMAF